MATIETVYLGDLRTSATHLQSEIKIITDAPVDNKGRGESFSPTDLLAASLGSCMLTIMGIAAKNYSIQIDNAKIEITKIMGNNPRRVIEIGILFNMPRISYSEKEKQILMNAAKTCPVALSLNPEINQNIIFNF